MLGGGGTWRGRRAEKRGHLGPCVLPIPHRRHKCIISFHVRTLGGGGRVEQEVRVQKTSKIQKKHPNFISNDVEKAGVGVQKAMWGRGGGEQKEPLKLRTERDLKRP